MIRSAIRSAALATLSGVSLITAGALAAGLPMKSGTWSADSYAGEGKQTVCETNGSAREDPSWILKIWHGYGRINNFHLRGYAPHADVTSRVGDYTETWKADAAGRIDLIGIANPTMIRSMIAQAKKGGVLSITGISADGRNTTLTYPLTGFPETYTAISEACRAK